MSFGEQEYTAAKSHSNYQSGLAGQMYGTGVRDWKLQRDSGLRSAYSGLANRGLVNSGIKRKDLGEYGSATLRGYGDLRSALEKAVAELAFQNMGTEMSYADPRFQMVLSEGMEAAKRQANVAEQYWKATQ